MAENHGPGRDFRTREWRPTARQLEPDRQHGDRAGDTT
jgi:hypothetical protein